MGNVRTLYAATADLHAVQSAVEAVGLPHPLVPDVDPAGEYEDLGYAVAIDLHGPQQLADSVIESTAARLADHLGVPVVIDTTVEQQARLKDAAAS